MYSLEEIDYPTDAKGKLLSGTDDVDWSSFVPIDSIDTQKSQWQVKKIKTLDSQESVETEATDEALDGIDENGNIVPERKEDCEQLELKEVSDSQVDANMAGWQQFNLHPSVIKGLKDLQFTHPTPIQTHALPLALEFYKDIIGAAETVLKYSYSRALVKL